jgi:hypothetical protein
MNSDMEGNEDEDGFMHVLVGDQGRDDKGNQFFTAKAHPPSSKHYGET